MCKDANRADDHCGDHEHHRRQPVGAQRHAERRRPGAEQIDQWVARRGHGEGNRDCDREADRQRRECDPFEVAAPGGESKQRARQRDDDR
jgi:hypothetical protein